MKPFLRLFLYAALLNGFSVKSLHASALLNIYEKFGGTGNYTSAGGFQDQAAGHYSGGGLTVRQKDITIQPIQVSFPSIGGGRCGSMDLFGGSLSFIKAQELVELGKSVVTGAPVYAFQLALKTAAPQIEGLVSEYMEKIRALNEMFLNQCHLTQQLVGGLWPANSAVSDQICKDVSAGNNMDLFGASKHCRKEETVASSRQKLQEKYPDLMVSEHNLVWYILDKMPNYKDKTELKEFMMNVAGTLLSVKDGNNFKYIHVSPKASSRQFLTAYLKGGTATVLKCDESKKCLKPNIVHTAIEKGVKREVQDRIFELRDKYLTKTALTEDEKSFLSDATTVPIYKYIQVSAATGSQFLTGDAAEYIAIAVLLYRFELMMTEILEAVEVISKIQMSDREINQFKESLKAGRLLIQEWQNATLIQARAMLNQAIEAEERGVLARNHY